MRVHVHAHACVRVHLLCGHVSGGIYARVVAARLRICVRVVCASAVGTWLLWACVSVLVSVGMCVCGRTRPATKRTVA
jgi:hypothetical protein